MNRLEEIKGRLSKVDTNMKVYRCMHFMDEDEACGIYEGKSLDRSYDECHHPLNRDLAEYIVNTPADIQYLLAKLEIAEKALEVAEKHVSGKAETFSEREKTPVLYQINEALKAIRE